MHASMPSLRGYDGFQIGDDLHRACLVYQDELRRAAKLFASTVSCDSPGHDMPAAICPQTFTVQSKGPVLYQAFPDLTAVRERFQPVVFSYVAIHDF